MAKASDLFIETLEAEGVEYVFGNYQSSVEYTESPEVS